MKYQKPLLGGLLFILLFVGESIALHNQFTTSNPGGNDFYSRWAGAKALLVEGRDPYGLDVTAEIQVAKGLDPEMEGKGSFAYPLHVIFLFLPLSYMDYAWAQAIWMVVLQWIVVATVFLLFRFARWQPSLPALAGMMLAMLFIYPVARSILLGQFTLHVTLFLVGMLLALRNGRDGWAGVLLAATSVKPQMVVFIGPWLVIWALAHKRWHFIWGLLAGGAAMFLLSLPFFPRWPISFIEDIQRYAAVAGGKNPLVVLVEQVWPGAGEPVRVVLTVILLVIMLWSWQRGVRNQEERPFHSATYWTIIASLLILFQTGTTNQTLLLIPLFDWLARLRSRQAGTWLIVVIMLILVIFPWALFLQTVEGDLENPLLFLPLPILSLAVLIGLEINQRCTGHRQTE
ncbi:MAG: DUF2029 domain-containing protein [Chloroflexi bacterium]|nr:DUF2029 domain-containing protein [Chloroflexota bacterium]